MLLSGVVSHSRQTMRSMNSSRYAQLFSEVAMKTMDSSNGMQRGENTTSLEKYLLLDENEKDLEIQRAVMRINKRIQEILYLIETDKQ